LIVHNVNTDWSSMKRVGKQMWSCVLFGESKTSPGFSVDHTVVVVM
jgi:hypothetical protein